ncbi:hypothetical protein JTB14_024673 [Gonioctena quinquepunctata]|nr:hypothetical protein JTB14_024673 [Gonioctena quinquepunctata]
MKKSWQGTLRNTLKTKKLRIYSSESEKETEGVQLKSLELQIRQKVKILHSDRRSTPYKQKISKEVARNPDRLADVDLERHLHRIPKYKAAKGPCPVGVVRTSFWGLDVEETYCSVSQGIGHRNSPLNELHIVHSGSRISSKVCDRIVAGDQGVRIASRGPCLPTDSVYSHP